MKNFKPISEISLRGVKPTLAGGENKGKGWSIASDILDNLANEASIIFDKAKRDQDATKQIERARALNWSNVPFFETLNSMTHPPPPPPKVSGFSGIEIILLLGLAAAAGTIIAKMANEKKQIQRLEKPVKQSIKSLKLK